jgi:hypothetical protein
MGLVEDEGEPSIASTKKAATRQKRAFDALVEGRSGQHATFRITKAESSILATPVARWLWEMRCIDGYLLRSH